MNDRMPKGNARNNVIKLDISSLETWESFRQKALVGTLKGDVFANTEPDDGTIVEGTPLNKANLFPDEAVQRFGLENDADPTPAKGFLRAMPGDIFAYTIPADAWATIDGTQNMRTTITDPRIEAIDDIDINVSGFADDVEKADGDRVFLETQDNGEMTLVLLGGDPPPLLPLRITLHRNYDSMAIAESFAFIVNTQGADIFELPVSGLGNDGYGAAFNWDIYKDGEFMQHVEGVSSEGGRINLSGFDNDDHVIKIMETGIGSNNLNSYQWFRAFGYGPILDAQATSASAPRSVGEFEPVSGPPYTWGEGQLEPTQVEPPSAGNPYDIYAVQTYTDTKDSVPRAFYVGWFNIPSGTPLPSGVNEGLAFGKFYTRTIAGAPEFVIEDDTWLSFYNGAWQGGHDKITIGGEIGEEGDIAHFTATGASVVSIGASGSSSISGYTFDDSSFLFDGEVPTPIGERQKICEIQSVLPPRGMLVSSMNAGNNFGAYMFMGCNGDRFSLAQGIGFLPPTIVVAGANYLKSMFESCSGAAFNLPVGFTIPAISQADANFLYRTFKNCIGAGFYVPSTLQFPQQLSPPDMYDGFFETFAVDIEDTGGRHMQTTTIGQIVGALLPPANAFTFKDTPFGNVLSQWLDTAYSAWGYAAPSVSLRSFNKLLANNSHATTNAQFGSTGALAIIGGSVPEIVFTADLPDWLSFNPATLAVSGSIPAQADKILAIPFTLTAINVLGEDSVSGEISFSVAPYIEQRQLLDVVVGTSLADTVNGYGDYAKQTIYGDFDSFNIISGSLFAGLSVDISNGYLEVIGTPTGDTVNYLQPTRTMQVKFQNMSGQSFTTSFDVRRWTKKNKFGVDPSDPSSALPVNALIAYEPKSFEPSAWWSIPVGNYVPNVGDTSYESGVTSNVIVCSFPLRRVSASVVNVRGEYGKYPTNNNLVRQIEPLFGVIGPDNEEVGVVSLNVGPAATGVVFPTDTGIYHRIFRVALSPITNPNSVMSGVYAYGLYTLVAG